MGKAAQRLCPPGRQAASSTAWRPFPYAALPVTAALSLETQQVPMIYPRKEVKAHGTGLAIEGAFEKGQTALAVEDVITTGGSILTSIKTLEEGGLAG